LAGLEQLGTPNNKSERNHSKSSDLDPAPKEKQRVHKCPHPGCNREMRRQCEMKYDLNLFSSH
jgi:hypothetical protein